MKTFFSEYTSNYQTYTFWYTQYAVIKSLDELDEAYDRGFLPYSGDLTLEERVFYRCRSLRVDLSRFTFNSENRRVARKAAEHEIVRKLWDKSEFDISQATFEQFCLSYAHDRYGAENMPIERFRYIMTRDYATHVMEYLIDGQVLGYIYLIYGEKFVHYWFSYYDVSYMDKFPVGTYLMADVISWAQEQWLDYVYLGTCYKESWLYKVRNFNATQRWDGNQWSDDTARLKSLCKTDSDAKEQDQFKDDISLYLLS